MKHQIYVISITIIGLAAFLFFFCEVPAQTLQGEAVHNPPISCSAAGNPASAPPAHSAMAAPKQAHRIP
jgi:hypothetical protein